MKLTCLYEGHWQVTKAPYLDPKGKAKGKKDYSFLLHPEDRSRFAKWGHRKKKRKKRKKK